VRNDTGDILIDDLELYEQARDFMQQVMPQHLPKLKYYQGPVPLFTRYQIESQIESAFQRQVRLPSGGAIVIDHTEALVTIDINSARATKGSDIEETALSTNLEAADEIARQLRLRDLGGLIVIDFIDMIPLRHQREVENRLRKALREDRARAQVGRISRFGLLEMSRQRVRSSLGESSLEVCPRCGGQGTIHSVESLALSSLRVIEEEAMKEKTAQVVAQLPLKVATYLLNEKRGVISTIEKRHGVAVVLVPNPTFETPHYEVKRHRLEEINAAASYEMVPAEEPEDLVAVTERSVSEQPVVKRAAPSGPLSEKPAIEDEFIKHLWSTLLGNRKEEELQSEKPANRESSRAGRRSGEDGGKPAQPEKASTQVSTHSEHDASRPASQSSEAELASEAASSTATAAPPAEALQTTEQEGRNGPAEGQAKQRGTRRGRRGGRNRRRKRVSTPPSTIQEGVQTLSPFELVEPTTRGLGQPSLMSIEVRVSLPAENLADNGKQVQEADGNTVAGTGKVDALVVIGTSGEPSTSTVAPSQGATPGVEGEAGGRQTVINAESRSSTPRDRHPDSANADGHSMALAPADVGQATEPRSKRHGTGEPRPDRENVEPETSYTNTAEHAKMQAKAARAGPDIPSLTISSPGVGMAAEEDAAALQAAIPPDAKEGKREEGASQETALPNQASTPLRAQDDSTRRGETPRRQGQRRRSVRRPGRARRQRLPNANEQPSAAVPPVGMSSATGESEIEASPPRSPRPLAWRIRQRIS
jgi:Ribonucleases G and E